MIHFDWSYDVYIVQYWDKLCLNWVHGTRTLRLKTAMKWIFSHINVRTGTLDKSERRYRLWKNDKVIAEYSKTIPKEVEA